MKPWRLLPLLAAVLLSACGELSLAVEQPTVTIASQPAIPATVTAPAQPPAVLPTALPTAVPSLPAPSATAAQDPTNQGPQMIDIYLIAVDDQGKSGTPVGCGDSVVPVQVEVPHTQAVLRAAIEALLAIKQRDYGQSGLYDALYQSDLKVESLSLQDGKASIHLTGTLLLGGECDNPRVEAQIIQTVRQFSTVTDVEVFINGKPLSEALSLK